MASENRVFDVAKPGSSKPETGSKPMVVGHKMMKDPSMKDSEETKSEEPQAIQQTVSKTIKPISKDMSPEPEASSSETKNDKNTSGSGSEVVEKEESNQDDKVEVQESKIVEEPEEKSDPSPETPENTAQQKEMSIQENAIAQEENLQKIIKEKTYNIHVEEASAHAFKTFLKTFIIVVVVGLVVLILLTDAEIIDLGISLPFDFL